MKKIDKKFKWNDFSVEKVEKKHNINLVAKREGLVEEPCSKSNGSITETEVIGEADKNLQGNTENLREYLSEVEKNQNELSKYLKQNNFQPIVNNLDASLNSYENKKEGIHLIHKIMGYFLKLHLDLNKEPHQLMS